MQKIIETENHICPKIRLNKLYSLCVLLRPKVELSTKILSFSLVKSLLTSKLADKIKQANVSLYLNWCQAHLTNSYLLSMFSKNNEISEIHQFLFSLLQLFTSSIIHCSHVEL